MKKIKFVCSSFGIALIVAVLSLLVEAKAQGCGPSNPNCIVPTAPLGTSNNQAASTEFVQEAISSGFPTPVFPVNASGLDTTINASVGIGSTALTLNSTWDIRTNQGIWLPFAGPTNTAGTPAITGVTAACAFQVSGPVSGSAVAGDTVSLVFTGAGIAGSPLTLTYTVATGDILSTVTGQLAALVNNNAALNAAQVLATTNGATTLSINYSSTLALTSVTSSHVGAAIYTPAAPTNCVTTTAYQVFARDVNGAFSAATGVTNATSATAAYNYNRAAPLNNTNTVNFTTGANTVDVVVCRNNVPIAIVDAADGTFTDVGQIALPTRDLPSTCPASPGNAPLITTATSVLGGLVGLANPAVAPITNAPIYHDDGVALQAAITSACPSKKLQIPVGTYNTHQQLGCIGSGPGNGMWLAGEGGTQRLGSGIGTIISGWGGGNEAVFYFDRLSGSKFSDFHILANRTMKYGMVYDNTNINGSSSGNEMQNISIYRTNSSAQSTLMSVGLPTCSGPTKQISEMGFHGVYWYGNDTHGETANGFAVWCGGNTKNFTFDGNYAIVSTKNAVFANTASGNWSFVQGTVGDIADTVFNGPQILQVIGLESENPPGTRFVGVGGGNFPCTLEFREVQFQTGAPPPWLFAADLGNCNVSMDDNQFFSGQFTGEYRFNVSALLEPTPIHPGAIDSRNNYFEASASLPFWNGGNKISAVGQFPSNGNLLHKVAISSKGDYGNTPAGVGVGGNIARFSTIDLTGGQHLLSQLYLRDWLTNKPGTPAGMIDLYGSSIQSRALATPSAPTVTVNTAGATTCGYKIAFRDATGNHTTPVSPATTHAAACAATPNNTISATAPAGAFFMDVIDNVSGMLIGTVNITQFQQAAWSLIDTGQAQTVYSPPSARNNTGEIAADAQITASAYATGAPRTTACPSANADTVLVTDADLIVNDAAATCTLTLLSAANYTGREIWIKTTQAQTVVSAASNVVPLVGGAAGTAILAATAGKFARLKSDGTNWIIMAGN